MNVVCCYAHSCWHWYGDCIRFCWCLAFLQTHKRAWAMKSISWGRMHHRHHLKWFVLCALCWVEWMNEWLFLVNEFTFTLSPPSNSHSFFRFYLIFFSLFCPSLSLSLSIVDWKERVLKMTFFKWTRWIAFIMIMHWNVMHCSECVGNCFICKTPLCYLKCAKNGTIYTVNCMWFMSHNF